MTDPEFVLHVYRAKSLRRSQRWRWRVVADNGHIVAESGEGYANREWAESIAHRVTGLTASGDQGTG